MDKLLELLKNINNDINYENENSLFTSKKLDSIDLVALMGDIEEEFGVEITYDMLSPENFDSIEKIWTLIQKLQI